MTNTTAKFTKRNALETLLALDAVKTDSRLVAYCENEIALLDKKKMSKSNAPSKRQKENLEKVVPSLKKVLATVDRATASQLSEKVATDTALEITDTSNTAQQTKLKEYGQYGKVKEKGVSWYSLAEKKGWRGLYKAPCLKQKEERGKSVG